MNSSIYAIYPLCDVRRKLGTGAILHIKGRYSGRSGVKASCPQSVLAEMLKVSEQKVAAASSGIWTPVKAFGMWAGFAPIGAGGLASLQIVKKAVGCAEYPSSDFCISCCFFCEIGGMFPRPFRLLPFSGCAGEHTAIYGHIGPQQGPPRFFRAINSFAYLVCGLS